MKFQNKTFAVFETPNGTKLAIDLTEVRTVQETPEGRVLIIMKNSDLHTVRNTIEEVVTHINKAKKQLLVD